MSLEAIAAMLGHKSMDMTLVYAKITNAPSPSSTSPSPKRSTRSTPRRPATRRRPRPEHGRLNRDHSRMLGNGYFARSKVMDCQYETICESCTFFQTTIEFRPTPLAQRADVCARGQVRRAQIYDDLITGPETTEAS